MSLKVEIFFKDGKTDTHFLKGNWDKEKVKEVVANSNFDINIGNKTHMYRWENIRKIEITILEEEKKDAVQPQH